MQFAARMANLRATPPLVTISAAYGAGGSRIGPAVAQRLGVEFLDRAIPTRVADRLHVPIDDALAHDESLGDAIGRLASSFALLPELGVVAAPILSTVAYTVVLIAHLHAFAGEIGGYRMLRPTPRETLTLVRGAFASR